MRTSDAQMTAAGRQRRKLRHRRFSMEIVILPELAARSGDGPHALA